MDDHFTCAGEHVLIVQTIILFGQTIIRNGQMTIVIMQMTLFYNSADDNSDCEMIMQCNCAADLAHCADDHTTVMCR